MGKASRKKREQRDGAVTRGMVNPRTGVMTTEDGGRIPLRQGANGMLVTGERGQYAYPFLADENGDVHMQAIPHPRGITLTTPTLVHLSRVAHEQPWCSKALKDDMLARLDPTGRHMIVRAFKHTTQDWKRDSARVHIMLKLRDQRDPDERMIDVPTRQFGIFLAAMQAATPRGVDPALEGVLLPEGYARLLAQPHWAAGRSFPKVWHGLAERFQAMSLLQVNGDHLAASLSEQGVSPQQVNTLVAQAHSPMTPLAATAYNAMASARLIVAEPEWVQGINDKRPDVHEVWKWAEQAHLPFDTVYLDCEGPAGLLPDVPVHLDDGRRGDELPIKLSGALMWREGTTLSVVPFGIPVHRQENRAAYMPLGRLVIGVDPPDGRQEVGISVDGMATSLAMTVTPPTPADGGGDLRGRVELPLTEAEYAPDDFAGIADVMAGVVTATALRALRVLYMLQAANVELVEAKLHGEGRRLLKRAQKRAWPIEIGLMVAVRWKKKLYLRPPGADELDPGGEGRGYSHAFWVTGHPAFYPLGTRIADALADADPSKLVEHEAKGLCRMVWRPPHIKGLKDPDTGAAREPVEKARKIVGDPYADGQGEAA